MKVKMYLLALLMICIASVSNAQTTKPTVVAKPAVETKRTVKTKKVKETKREQNQNARIKEAREAGKITEADAERIRKNEKKNHDAKKQAREASKAGTKPAATNQPNKSDKKN